MQAALTARFGAALFEPCTNMHVLLNSVLFTSKRAATAPWYICAVRRSTSSRRTPMLDTDVSWAVGDIMALQAQLRLCAGQLEKYEPNVPPELLDPVHLVSEIRRKFDAYHPASARTPPLHSRDDATNTLCQQHGDIWNGVDSDEVADNSLRACCEHVLVAAMGAQYQAYCREQSYCALLAVRHALLGAHIGSRWEDLVRPAVQETIVWHILCEHLTAMQHDIRLRLQN